MSEQKCALLLVVINMHNGSCTLRLHVHMIPQEYWWPPSTMVLLYQMPSLLYTTQPAIITDNILRYPTKFWCRIKKSLNRLCMTVEHKWIGECMKRCEEDHLTRVHTMTWGCIITHLSNQKCFRKLITRKVDIQRHHICVYGWQS